MARLLTLAFFLAGCAPRMSGPLVDMDSWTLVDGADDPFVDEAPDSACDDPTGAHPEDYGPERSFAIETFRCARATVVQPTLLDIRKGDDLFVRGWHDMLTGPNGAQAVFLVGIDGEELWRGTADIPSEFGAAILGHFSAPRAFPGGAAIAWHAHNHGANSYHLLELSVNPPADE